MDAFKHINDLLKEPFSGRRVIAIAGPPASGKSTSAEAVADAVDGCCVVPMDGFHLDNGLLDARGLRAVKGAPQTFDALGFVRLVERLKVEDEVLFPRFSRELDMSIACAGAITADIKTVIVEGNYLLLDRPVWKDLHTLWDKSIMLTVPSDALEARLVQRWIDQGHSPEDAKARAMRNDIPNARLVINGSIGADVVIANT